MSGFKLIHLIRNIIKIKKRINLACLVLIMSGTLHAQSQEADVVYLNNGTYLIGKIIELFPEHSLRICISQKDTLCVDLADIRLIKKENRQLSEFGTAQPEPKESGYTFMCELGFGLGVLEGLDRYKDQATAQYLVLLSVFNGFRFSPVILLGLGTGIEAWNTRMFIPVYLDFRANFLRNVNTPFIYINAGYSLGWMSGDRGPGFGGAMAGLGLGGRFRISKKNLMTIALGYRFQQMRQNIETYSVSSKATRDAHFVSLKLGIVF